jgi:opacity protein-like surface antigen
MKKQLIMTAICMVVLSWGVMAQDKSQKLAFELRPGVSFATNKLGDACLNAGMGVEGQFQFNLWKNVDLYAGWGWNKFSSDKTQGSDKIDFEETGYVMGFRYTHSLPQAPHKLFLRAGAVYNHIEAEAGDDIIADTNHGWGWQTEAGVEIMLGKGWLLRPGLKYQALRRDLVIDNLSRSIDLNYVSLGLGIARKF